MHFPLIKMWGGQQAQHSATSPPTLNTISQALEEVQGRLHIAEQRELTRATTLNHILTAQSVQSSTIQTYRNQDNLRHQHIAGGFEESRLRDAQHMDLLQTLMTRQDKQREEDRKQWDRECNQRRREREEDKLQWQREFQQRQVERQEDQAQRQLERQEDRAQRLLERQDDEAQRQLERREDRAERQVERQEDKQREEKWRAEMLACLRRKD